MSKQKPMSKAKKELIAYIISLVTGALLIATGIIMEYTKEGKSNIVFIFGIIIACLGAILIGMSIYGTYIASKKLKQEKAQ